MSDTNVEVGITADDSGLVQGFQDAQQVVQRGAAEMQSAAASTTASFDAMGASMKGFMAQAAAVDQMLETEAKSLDDVTARRAAYSAALASGVLTQSEYAAAAAVLTKQEQALIAEETKVAAAAERVAAAHLEGGAAAQKLAADQEKLNIALAQGLISQERYAAATAAIAGERVALEEVGGAASAATRELGVMTGEALRGNFGRLEQSTVTLANRTGLLAQAFSPIGALVAGIAAGLFLVGDAMVKNAEETARFNSVAEIAGSTSAHTGEQLRKLSEDVAGITGNADDAQKAVQSLAMSGKFAGDTLDQAAKGAAAFADLTGTKIEQAAAQFEKLGEDPVKALLELDSKTHMVDSSIVALVARAQEQGNTFAAATIATQAMSKSLQEADENAKKFAADHSALATFSMSVSDAASAEAGLGQTLIFDRQKADEAAEAHKRLSDARAIVGNAAQNSVNQIIEALTKEKDKLDEVTATYGKGKVGLADYTIAKAEATVKSIALTAAEQTFFEELKAGINFLQAGRDAYAAYSHTIDAAKGTLDGLEQSLRASAAAADAAKSSHSDFKDEMNAEAEAAKGLADQQAMLAKLAGDTGDAYDKAWAQQQKDIREAVDAYAKAASAENTLGEAEENLGRSLDMINQKYDRRIDILNNSLDAAMDRINTRHREEIDSLKGLGVQQEIEKQYLQDLATFTKAWTDLKGKDVEVTDEWKQKIHDAAEETVQMREKMKEAQQIMQGWVQIGANGLDQFFGTLNKDLLQGGSLMKDLANVWQSVVQSILLQAEKLLIINPILNSIFGTAAGGGNYLPALLGAGSSGGGLFGSVLGGGGGSAGGASLFSPSSWMSAGQSLFSGFSSGIGSLWSGTATGGSSILGSGIGPGFMGPLGPGQAYGYTPSMFGNVVGIGGGILAGIGEYNAAGGGAAGLVGGAAYGLGTLTATGAIGGILSGAGASAGAAGALGSVGLGAIPVVGWVALAAMAINMITGGGLFGTSWKPTGGEQDLNIGPSGASAQDLTFESRKRALFGGTAHRTVTSDDPKAAAGLQDFATSLQTGLDAFMAQFGTDTADIVAGTFKTTFDKHGKATGTSDTVLGVTRTGETVEQFTQRIQADSFLAALDKMGLGASQFVAGLQGDTQKLLAAVQDFAATTQIANTNLTNGFHFMALGVDQTLKSTMEFVKGLNQSGETLQQTYQRLAQAQVQYNQFVAQFQPAASYVDPFEAAVAQLRDQMMQAEAQANALAQAAGATGANLEDLDNIHKKYSADLAALTAQLQANAQSLAFSLGLTLQGSLDQINQEIADLTKGTTTASTSLSSFGGAVHDVAAKTNAALDLMLGNLSPLNDQQKLQYALQGLRAGTVSADTVLGIGRALYASSEAYNTLFEEVLPYAGRGKGTRGGGAASSIQTDNSSQTSTLSPADQEKLKELERRKDILEKQQNLQQFQTLAQQVAEIAQAKGETVNEVLADMGIDLKDFEKGLGIANDEDFKAYMDGLQKQTDSAGDNTRSIVDAINQLPSKLAQILGMDGRGQGQAANSTTDRSKAVTGTDRSRGDGSSSGSGGQSAPAPRSRGDGSMTDREFVKAFGNEVYTATVRAIQDSSQPGTPRNIRGRALA